MRDKMIEQLLKKIPKEVGHLEIPEPLTIYGTTFVFLHRDGILADVRGQEEPEMFGWHRVSDSVLKTVYQQFYAVEPEKEPASEPS